MKKTKILSGNAYIYEAKLKEEEKFFSKKELNKILSFYGMRAVSYTHLTLPTILRV